jgi:polysaccharide transporter, PST family
MSQVETHSEKRQAIESADSFASGLSFTVVTNIVQRGIGFIRNVALCHFLSDDKLGLWALASCFFMLAAPLSVMGLPGCFGKFVEYYRVRGQLHGFVQRVTIGAFLGSAAFFGFIVYFSNASSQLAFGETLSRSTMVLVGLVLLGVTWFNFVVELLSGLRRPKTVSSMLLINSLAFTVLALGVCVVQPSWQGLVVAFGLSAILGLYPAVKSLRTSPSENAPLAASISMGEMWRRVLPYALSMWTMNLLVNSFEVVDRYMLLYLIDDKNGLGLRLIGQFHSARLLPLLLFSLATVVSGMLLPYLSADWERNRRQQVAASTRATLKFAAVAFMAFSVGAIAFAPYLFDLLLKDRFSLGQDVMPVAMVCCVWTSLTFIAQNYLWCAEKTRAITLSLAVGLVVNIVLNFLFIPEWGLHGAVWATAIASAINLGLVIWSMQRNGCELTKSMVVFLALPLLIAFSTEVAAIGLAVLILLAGRTQLLLTRDEKRMIENALKPMFALINWHRPCFAAVGERVN